MGLVDARGVTHYPLGTTEVELGEAVAPPDEGHEVVLHVGQVAADGTASPVARPTLTLEEPGAFDYLFPVPEEGGTFSRTA